MTVSRLRPDPVTFGPIIIDTREQIPFTFEGFAADVVRGQIPQLNVPTVPGETNFPACYTLAGLSELIAVRHLTLDDLFGVLQIDWPAFVRGLEVIRDREAADAEQVPLSVLTERGTLKSGDYSLSGLQPRVAAERKSLADLFNTIGQGRERFERELARLNQMEYAAVVFEANWDTVLFDPPKHSRLSPKTVFRSVIAWQQKYPRVHWWPCGSRRFAETATLRILMRFAKEHEAREKAKK